MSRTHVSAGASGGTTSAETGIATSVTSPNPTAKSIRIGKPSTVKDNADLLGCQGDGPRDSAWNRGKASAMSDVHHGGSNQNDRLEAELRHTPIPKGELLS
jgi:hypothetical protein